MTEYKREGDTPNLEVLLDVLRGSSHNLLFDGATETEVVDLENKIGKRLPLSFRAFLKVSDGASLYDDSIEIFGTKNGFGDLQISLEQEKDRMSYLPDYLIPVSHSDTFYYFDLRSGKEGEYEVVKWDEQTGQVLESYGTFTRWLEEKAIKANESGYTKRTDKP